jgi:hypothetical protein
MQFLVLKRVRHKPDLLTGLQRAGSIIAISARSGFGRAVGKKYVFRGFAVTDFEFIRNLFRQSDSHFVFLRRKSACCSELGCKL